jgi:hypothetical protein
MSNRIYLAILIMISGMLAVICWPAEAQYIPETHKLISGQPVTISVSGANQLWIVSHPGGNTSRKRKISLHTSTYKWTPPRAGLYTISTPGGPAQTVSVRFGYFPVKGLIIFSIAFIILFGGAALSSYVIFSDR